MKQVTVTKLNKRPLTLYANAAGDYYFNFKGWRCYLKEYTRAHHNPWFNGEALPDFIKGVHNGMFAVAPLIGIEGGKINVYKETEEK